MTNIDKYKKEVCIKCINPNCTDAIKEKCVGNMIVVKCSGFEKKRGKRR